MNSESNYVKSTKIFKQLFNALENFAFKVFPKRLIPKKHQSDEGCTWALK